MQKIINPFTREEEKLVFTTGLIPAYYDDAALFRARRDIEESADVFQFFVRQILKYYKDRNAHNKTEAMVKTQIWWANKLAEALKVNPFGLFVFKDEAVKECILETKSLMIEIQRKREQAMKGADTMNK